MFPLGNEAGRSAKASEIGIREVDPIRERSAGRDHPRRLSRMVVSLMIHR
jgi:hypothetical protein